jgi:hypothetical protein
MLTEFPAYEWVLVVVAPKKEHFCSRGVTNVVPARSRILQQVWVLQHEQLTNKVGYAAHHHASDNCVKCRLNTSW